MNLHIRHSRLFLAVALPATVLWASAVLLLTRTIPIGLQIGEGQTAGAVTCLASLKNGHEWQSDERRIAPGTIMFSIPRNALSFRFHFKAENGDVAFPLEGISFFGITILTPRRMAGFQTTEKIYQLAPNGDGPLVVSCPAGAELNLPNVFPVASRLLRIAAYAVAAFPFALAVLVLCLLFFGSRFIALADRVLSRRLFWIVVVVVASVLLMPNPVTPAGPGLDPSWIWLFNRFAFTGSVGRDFVFTYGPLGFLISPQVSFQNVVVGILFNACFLAAAGWLFVLLHKHAATMGERICVYLLLFVWLLPWPNGMEWRWCAVGVMTAAVAALHRQINERCRTGLWILTAVLAVGQSFVKFSNLLSVVSQQGAFLIGFLVLQRRESLRGVLAYCLTLALAFAIGTVELFPSIDAFSNWIRGSIEIATGYNLYMACERVPVEFVAPIIVLLALPAVWLIVKRAHIRRALLWIMLSPLVFCAYKYAVVRQGSQPLLLLLVWLSLILARLDSSFRRNGLIVACLSLLLFVGVKVCLQNDYSVTDLSLQNVVETCCPWKSFQEVKRVEVQNLASSRMSSKMRSLIGTNEVMIVGSDFGVAMSEDIRLVPFPATQDYSAYTPWLEQFCIDRITDARRPLPFLLVPLSPGTIDGRNVCFDNPRLWRSICRQYDFVCAEGDLALLVRRSEARRDVLPHGQELALRRGLANRLRSLVFRPRRQMAVVSYEDGTSQAYAANPLMLDGTQPPTLLPQTKDEMLPYLQGDWMRLPKVKSVHFYFSE